MNCHGSSLPSEGTFHHVVFRSFSSQSSSDFEKSTQVPSGEMVAPPTLTMLSASSVVIARRS
ncbi:MAG: hypothetical protein OXU38_12600 [Gemmatimonadota bacterium]|nr:hypothetical protein [Gemmatimonadota bacterium]